LRERLAPEYDNFHALVTAAIDLEDRLVTPAAEVNYVFKRKKNRPQQSGNGATKYTAKPPPKQSVPSSGPPPSQAKPKHRVGQGVRCFNCNGTGHFSKDCPSPSKPRKVNTVDST